MTFDFADFCLPVAQSSHLGGLARSQGIEDALNIVLMESGSCRWQAAEGPGGQAGPGTLILAGRPVIITPLEECASLTICLGGSAPRQAAQQLSGGRALPAGTCPGLEELMQTLADQGMRLAPAEKSSIGYMLLCRLVQAAEQGHQAPPLVTAAVAEIHEHYGEVYGVEELAAGLEVTKSHLIRCFTAHMGVSPGKYLTAVRVENAKRMLLDGGFSLDMIASLCGFSGANYLCKVFKKETGETPGEWRARAGPAVSLQPAGEWEEQLYL